MNEPSTARDPTAELEALEAKARERTNTEERIVQLEARLAQLENMQLSNDVEGKLHHTPGGGTVLELHPATTPSSGGGGGAAANVRVFFVDLDPAGSTASEAEIDLALERAYYDTYPTPTTVTPPLDDDMIVVRIGATPTFTPTYVYTVRTTAFTESGQFVRTFTVDLGVPGTPNVTSFYAVGWKMEGGAASGRGLHAEVSMAGLVPDDEELTTAIDDAYTDAGVSPQAGDMVSLTAGGATFVAHVFLDDVSPDGTAALAFTGGYAMISQVGLI